MRIRASAAVLLTAGAVWGPAWCRPIGQAGLTAEYQVEISGEIRPSVVKRVTLSLGATETRSGREYQWFGLDATKADGRNFRVWLLSDGYPAATIEQARASLARYVFQEAGSAARDFRGALDGAPVLPSIGGWSYLLPRGGGAGEPFPASVRYLGHSYTRISLHPGIPAAPPANAAVLKLRPDMLVGPPSNRRQKDETRRYDDSEYEYQTLTRDDYRTMAAAGINCVNVNLEQAAWAEDLGVFYWNAEGQLPFPEFLYRPLYLGPVLFFDEPGVGTRDYVLRPRLNKDEAFRRAISPQAAFDAFRKRFRESMERGAPLAMMRGLAARKDVDPGDMKFAQRDLYTWETMVSTYAWQLSQDPHVPAAVVFEPPGHIGTARTIPEMNMTYGTQIPVGDPHALADILFGFLRGAARATGKDWGVSIYGSVPRADSGYWFTHAYDLGATRFHFWDNARLACVPFGEVLALSRLLREHAHNNPHRDLPRLRRSAEVAILLPPGYNLGHVYIGKGPMWGLGELNLERTNRDGVKYRTVMSNFFVEIERCLRLGVAFDLLWDLPATQPKDYREVVRVRENGKVEVTENGRTNVFDGARKPVRPGGDAPRLSVALSAVPQTRELLVTARARVTETTAPVYYTMGPDLTGIYHNEMVAFELYGPEPWDQRFLSPPQLRPTVRRQGAQADVDMQFPITRPGSYRLRAATVDLAGRTTVVWTPLVAAPDPATGHLQLK
ncbi:MAG: hypothetical protein IT160_04720 [Bryobacterales bacterium]|nr:hypothetical protein [Bryobacterales bacterium]